MKSPESIPDPETLNALLFLGFMAVTLILSREK